MSSQQTSPPASPVDAAQARYCSQCCCCGTVIAHPSATRFVCRVCGTYATAAPASPPESVSISYTQLRKEVNECSARLPDVSPVEAFQPLEASLLRLFQTHSALALAFPHATDPIDTAAVGRYFRALQCLPSKRPLYAALKGIVYCLRRPEDVTSARWMLVALLVPVLYPQLAKRDNKTLEGLAYEIVKRSLGLLAHGGSSADDIVAWAKLLPDPCFTAHADGINVYILMQLRAAPRRMLSAGAPEPSKGGVLGSLTKSSPQIPPLHYLKLWHVRSGCRMMTLLAHVHRRKVSPSTFYNTMVDCVNIKQDYDLWRKSRRHHSGFIAAILQPMGTTSTAAFTTDHHPQPQTFFCAYPCVILLGGKITVLEHEARRTMERRAEEAFVQALDTRTVTDVYLWVRVRRRHLVNDSLRQLESQQQCLQKSLRVEFVGEAGVDAGGLRKEWFLLVLRALFLPASGMFTETESGVVWFNLTPYERPAMYRLVGQVLGLAIHNSTILDMRHFPHALFRVLLGKLLGWGDYLEMYPQTAKGLEKVYRAGAEVAEWGLTFEATFKNATGDVKTVELVDGGSKMAVTGDNARAYVRAYMDFFLTKQPAAVIAACREGFDLVVSPNALLLFAPSELLLLVCGSDEETLDVPALRSITKYTGNAAAPVVGWFWDAVATMTPAQQKDLLLFVTGSDRVPATGWHTMSFKVSVEKGWGERLPVAHTCFNQLVLWGYQDAAVLRNKLLYAISASEGFALR